MRQRTGRGLFVALVLFVGGWLFMALCSVVRSGQAWASVAIMLTTTVGLMSLTWLIMQRGNPRIRTMTSRDFSYAAILGDALVVPAVATITAMGWNAGNHGISAFWRSWVWTLLPAGFGLACGIAFHMMGGRSDSQSSVRTERLHDSATSWAHNLGSLPAIAGTFLCTVLPLFTNSASRAWAIAAVTLIAMWLGLAAIDGARIARGTFDPNWLDTEMSWGRWSPRRS